jgi:hypothetical protein
LELAISPSFFRPVFFFFFLEVERRAEATFGDTAVPRNYDGPHVAEGLPLRAGGKAWCVSSLGRTEDFSEAAIMESKQFPLGSLNVKKSPLAEGEELPGLPLRAGGEASGLGRTEGFSEAALMESKSFPMGSLNVEKSPRAFSVRISSGPGTGSAHFCSSRDSSFFLFRGHGAASCEI